MTFTIETKFLDTRHKLANCIVTTEVYHKATKFTVHLNWHITKIGKRNAINGDLYHRSYRICSNFNHEKNKNRNKFSTAGYPMRFVNGISK